MSDLVLRKFLFWLFGACSASFSTIYVHLIEGGVDAWKARWGNNDKRILCGKKHTWPVNLKLAERKAGVGPEELPLSPVDDAVNMKMGSSGRDQGNEDGV